jgi:hypothetical protein
MSETGTLHLRPEAERGAGEGAARSRAEGDAELMVARVDRRRKRIASA